MLNIVLNYVTVRVDNNVFNLFKILEDAMNFRIISSLEKCFLDEKIDAKKELCKASLLKNESFSFQLAYQTKLPTHNYLPVRLEIISPLKEHIEVYRVQNLPCEMPFFHNQWDDDVLRTESGLYPDALIPMDDDRILVFHTLHALWFDVKGREELPAGVYPVTLRFVPLEQTTKAVKEGAKIEEVTLTLEVIDAVLPEQTTKVTQWLHCDCLQSYYYTEPFDERHWQLIENFMSTAVEHGVNMMFTPLFTPALDTFVGGERPTTQLVGVKKKGESYSFDFSLLERWVTLCNKLGVKYFEINHLFTQWGAKHCPKIMAEVDGEMRRIFGWDSEAAGHDYRNFLNQFIPAFLDFMKSLNGADERCYFHVSDEPREAHLEYYKAAREVLMPLVEGHPVMDALSHVEFYDKGVVTLPVPEISKFSDFYPRDIEERWVYYCGDSVGINRFFAYPSQRNRILGVLMYKFGAKGFLHWGYNFYYNENSFRTIDPWICTDGEGFVPSGDAFIVYPGRDGSCIPSIRLKVLNQAFQDQRAMELCEQLYSKEFTLGLLEAETEELDFTKCPRDPDYIPRVREKINMAIRDKIS